MREKRLPACATGGPRARPARISGQEPRATHYRRFTCLYWRCGPQAPLSTRAREEVTRCVAANDFIEFVKSAPVTSRLFDVRNARSSYCLHVRRLQIQYSWRCEVGNGGHGLTLSTCRRLICFVRGRLAHSPNGGLCAVIHPDFAEERLDVNLDGGFSDIDLPRYNLV